MKINMIVGDRRGGLRTCTNQLVKALRERGNKVSVSDKSKQYFINHAHIHTLTDLLNLRPDIYTLYGPLGYDFKTIWKKLKLNPSHYIAKMPMLFSKTMLNTLPPIFRWPKTPNIEGVVTCMFLKNFLKDHHLVGNLQVIPPAVEGSKLSSISFRNNKKILFTGKKFRERGEVQVLKAAPKVLEEHPDVEFIIACKHYSLSKYKRKYKEIAKNLGIRKRVKFYGFLKEREIYNLLEAATIATYPYLTHDPVSVPVSLLEAMAHAKPIVSTRIGAIPETIRDNESGFLIEPGDTADLAKKIIKLLDSPNLRRKLGKNAFREIKEKHNPRKVADKYLNVYENLQK